LSYSAPASAGASLAARTDRRGGARSGRALRRRRVRLRDVAHQAARLSAWQPVVAG